MEVIKKRRRRKEDVTTRMLYVLVLLVRQAGFTIQAGRAGQGSDYRQMSPHFMQEFCISNQYFKLHASEHVGKL